MLIADVNIFFLCSGNKISAKGAQALAKALKCNKSLTHLNLDSTCLNDEEFAFYPFSFLYCVINAHLDLFFIFYSWIGGK